MGDIDLKEEYSKSIAELLRDFTIFFAVLVFTCIVGIIELLPELEKVSGSFGFISLTFLYFVLLLGIVFSIIICFRLYDKNKTYSGIFTYIFNEIEYLRKKGIPVKWLLIIIAIALFTIIYLVKIGILF